MSFGAPITIEKAVSGIQANKYVLPAIQREFIWKADQIEKLFDSLLKGYPIGSFLFWKVQPAHLGEFQFYKFMDHYHERDCRHNEPIEIVGSQEVIAVLDGQQRLTALNIGLRGWYADKLPYYRWTNDYAFPKRYLFLNLLPSPKDDVEFTYEFKMLREDTIAHTRVDDKFWFPVSDILKFDDVQDVFDYCVGHGLTQDGEKFPHHTLIGLWRVVKEKTIISFFQEEEQNLDRVLNIFIRVNSGGTQLSYSDMLLSIATAQWKSRDARQEIYGLVDELNRLGEGFNFNKDFALKASLVLTDIPTIEFRVNSFNRDNMLLIEACWDKITTSLTVVTHLLASWGYNWQTLISNNAVIPLAYYLYKNGSPSNFTTSALFKDDRDKMRRWLAIALLKRTFSGQPDNVLRPIRRVIKDHHKTFPIEVILDELAPTSKSMRFDEVEIDGILSYRYGQNYTFSVLALLYPWLKYDQRFHMDHIFPRAMFNAKELKQRGISHEQWHHWLDNADNLVLQRDFTRLCHSERPKGAKNLCFPGVIR
ncbi:MAG: DUF262 domain-containing protein, partial [Thermoflexales bacterium]|nr:DUF262 domain-containing protein [Thermoflexales bacterium]